ncbi:MAG: hypothetical protein K6A44_01850 [bacterium]|nr:hypothetical protein [bacterium]
MLVELDLNRQSNYKNIATVSDTAQNKSKDKQSFGGFGDAITTALIASDKSPMIGVSIIDLCSMIFPRTFVDMSRNGFAATETFLRESAGLIINCLIPSFVVYGVAKLLQKPVMGEKFSSLNPAKMWANQKNNEMLTTAWLSTKDAASKEARVGSYVSKVLDNIEGLAGKNDWRKISDLANRKEIYSNITQAILSGDKKQVEQATNLLIDNLKASRNIRLVNKTPFAALEGVTELGLDSNIRNLVRDMNEMGQAFMKTADSEIPAFSKKLTKLVNRKSLAGLGVIVALGASFQFFNRMLTKYRTGSGDFVGEADYLEQLKSGKKPDKKEICEKERRKLNLHKVMGTAGMALLAILSFGKKPTLNMFQFNGMFPTLNQCRAISAVTYSGRIISSANDNELKETGFRDTLTFINLYYLGDYVSKAYATCMEKFGSMKGQLLNETCKLKDNANLFDKFWHWFRHTELKGFEELSKNPAVKRNRAFAQASGLLYSCIVLGLIVPLYNKHRTNKKAQEKRRIITMINELERASKIDDKKVYKEFFVKNPNLK